MTDRPYTDAMMLEYEVEMASHQGDPLARFIAYLPPDARDAAERIVKQHEELRSMLMTIATPGAELCDVDRAARWVGGHAVYVVREFRELQRMATRYHQLRPLPIRFVLTDEQRRLNDAIAHGDAPAEDGYDEDAYDHPRGG